MLHPRLAGWNGLYFLAGRHAGVLPYFLPGDTEKPDFAPWVLGRAAIAAYATVLGIMFGQSLGVVLPETFGYLPMTLVIVTAAASCCLQLCAMIKFRLAR